MAKAELYLPSTFFEFVHSSEPEENVTWKSHVDGAQYRIDYIGCNYATHCMPHSAQVLYSFPMLNTVDDHWPVQVDLTFTPGVSSPPWKRRSLPYDPDLFTDETRAAAFKQIIAQCPSIPFCVDPTSHAHILDTYILKALTTCFPKQRRKKVQPYITDATFEEVSYLRDVRKQWFYLRRRVREHQQNHRDVPEELSYLLEWVTSFLKPHTAYVQGLLKDDWKAHLKDKARSDENKLLSGDARLKHSVIRKCKTQFKHNVLIRLQKEDGTPASSYVEEQELFRGHFGKVLCGTVTTFEELILKERQRPQVPCHTSVEQFEQLVMAPTALHAASAVSPSFKAVGENLLHPRAHKLFPSTLSAAMFPLVFKTHCLIRPCLQWRGGMLAAL